MTSGTKFLAALCVLLAALYFSPEANAAVRQQWRQLLEHTGEASIRRATLRYFNVRGLGEVVRLALEELAIPYDQEMYTAESWPQAKEANTPGLFAFGQVPSLSIETADGTAHLVQSMAIVKQIARRHGFACPAADEYRCDLLAMGASDLRKRLSELLYSKATFSSATRRAFYSDVFPTWLGYFENLLPGGENAIAGRQTWVDWVLFDLFDSLLGAAQQRLPDEPIGNPILDPFKASPKVAQLFEAVRQRPRVAAYLASNRRLPYSVPHLPPPAVTPDVTSIVQTLLQTAVNGSSTWAAKANSHVPVITRNKGRINIRVVHPMSEVDGHYIDWIFAVAGNERSSAAGEVVAAVRFSGAEPTPEFEFEPTGPVTVFVHCTLHGLWSAEAPLSS